MKINNMWVVIDPGPRSAFDAICYQTTPQELVSSVGQGWADGLSSSRERLASIALYTDGDEATADAERRLAERDAKAAAELQKPERVEAGQPWRVAGEDRDLEVASVDDGEATLRVRSRATSEWVEWGRAPVTSMLTGKDWTFLGASMSQDQALDPPPHEGGLALAL